MKIADRDIIILCTSRIYDPQVHGYIELMNERLRREKCALLIYTINSDLYWDDANITAEATVFDVIPYDIADAVIIMDEKIKSHTVSQKIIDKSRKHNTPVVIVDGYYEGVQHINFDYGAGFEQVVRHVMEQREIKKPHIMAGIQNNPFSDERIDIFKKVISEYGFKFDDSMLSYGQFWAAPSRVETEKIIESGDIPDAIICANDIMAINVCDVLHQHGIRVPDDVIVSGFDGYDEVFITSPKITTVSCTTLELADATVDMILKIVKGDHKELVGEETISVIPTLVPNESTGCPVSTGFSHSMLDRFNNSFYRHQDSVRIMHEVITAMQMSRTPGEMIEQLKNLIINDQNVIEDVSFAINKNIFDKEDYFFDNQKAEIDITDFSLIYDANLSPYLRERASGDISDPINNKFWQKIKGGYPLIFNAIDYMNTPLGFVCYDYMDYDITKYSRTANVTNTISMGIGGYVNMTYQRDLADKVDKMYRLDYLTGLYNRIGFSTVYDELRNRKDMLGKQITVIMSDLDGLKYINDNFGHAEGDNAIVTAARALKNACPEKAICVRFGGDELFAVIIGDCDIDSIIKKIDKILSEYNKQSEKEYSVIASCGSNTSVFDKDFDIKNALKIADEQMYNIKKEHQRSSWYSFL